MIITFSGKINTEAIEEKVFKEMKQFFSDNFQDYEFNITGTNKTLRDEYHKPKEEPKPEPKKYSASQALKQEQLIEEAKKKIADEVDKAIVEDLDKDKVVLG